ncbi:MAG: riboflavin synthase [Gemmatimonadota bacterium]|nr:MAG: riboflavin synthase [Gemmatimonadota bacterium]
MFTGIVTEVGKVSAVQREEDRLAFTIEAPYEDLVAGDSIAVSGACLTVVEKGDNWFKVEAIVTTRGRTWFGDLQVGDEVNLERSLQIGDRLGGHFVQGHVDGVGTVRRVEEEADAVLIDIHVPDETAELTVPHGSITFDGVSLTVNATPEPNVVQVALIPYTLEHTTLRNLKPGDPVHIEGDMIGKFVRQLLRDRGN